MFANFYARIPEPLQRCSMTVCLAIIWLYGVGAAQVMAYSIGWTLGLPLVIAVFWGLVYQFSKTAVFDCNWDYYAAYGDESWYLPSFRYFALAMTLGIWSSAIALPLALR